MTDTLKLDMPADELFRNIDSRPLLDRCIRATLMDGAAPSYAAAYDLLAEAAESARNMGDRTLGGALKMAGADPTYVLESVRLLEQRDAAVASAYQRAAEAEPILLEQTDQRGMTMLDQGPSDGPSTANAKRNLGVAADDSALRAARAVADPVEREHRYQRARKLDAQYSGADGRKLFAQNDRLHLDAGLDLVRSLERGAAEQRARVAADRVTRQLDQAIATAEDKRSALRQLDRELETLTADKRAQRDRLAAQVDAADSNRLVMLDQATNPQPTAPAGSQPTDQERLDQLSQTQSPREFLKTLDNYVRGGGLPEPPSAVADDPPAAPRGVDPGSHHLHRRIKKYMLDNGLPDSEYIAVAERVHAGQLHLDEVTRDAPPAAPSRRYIKTIEEIAGRSLDTEEVETIERGLAARKELDRRAGNRTHGPLIPIDPETLQ